MPRYLKISMLIVVLLIGGMTTGYGLLQAQVQVPTSTPAPVQINSPTPPGENTAVTGSDSVGSSPDGDFDVSGETATPRNLIMIEPISEVTVRSSPEILDDNQIGTIGPGDRFNVLGRYFNWIEFQYDAAPDQRGWVYRDLVDIEGNIDAIPTVVLNPTATVDPNIQGATQTIEAILAQPDGALTVTAQARVINLPENAKGDNSEGGDSNRQIDPEITAPPTFTYPPNVAVGVPTLEVTRAINVATPTDTNERAIAPIILILVLGGFGLLGLVVSIVRGI